MTENTNKESHQLYYEDTQSLPQSYLEIDEVIKSIDEYFKDIFPRGASFCALTSSLSLDDPGYGITRIGEDQDEVIQALLDKPEKDFLVIPCVTGKHFSSLALVRNSIVTGNKESTGWAAYKIETQADGNCGSHLIDAVKAMAEEINPSKRENNRNPVFQGKDKEYSFVKLNGLPNGLGPVVTSASEVATLFNRINGTMHDDVFVRVAVGKVKGTNQSSNTSPVNNRAGTSESSLGDQNDLLFEKNTKQAMEDSLKDFDEDFDAANANANEIQVFRKQVFRKKLFDIGCLNIQGGDNISDDLQKEINGAIQSFENVVKDDLEGAKTLFLDFIESKLTTVQKSAYDFEMKKKNFLKGATDNKEQFFDVTEIKEKIRENSGSDEEVRKRTVETTADLLLKMQSSLFSNQSKKAKEKNHPVPDSNENNPHP